MTNVRKEIAAMQGYVPGEQPQTGKIIKLNTNENPYPCSPAVKRALGRVCQQGLERYPDPLCTSFRVRAAELLGVEPDWILCGNGSDDILTILVRGFVGAGEKIRYPLPSYILYKTLADIQGATAEHVRFTEDWKLDERFYAPDADLKLAFLPNPNSPSGTILKQQEVAELAGKMPCPLVVDEAYADFAEENCLDLVKENENVLITRTLSKSYALAGMRFGYLVAQPQVIHELLKVKDSYNCDALSIAGATAAVDDQNWLQENLQKIRATRKRLTESLADLGFRVIPSQANFVFCTHSTAQSSEIYEALKKANIIVRYMNYDGWGDGLRISVGTDEQVDACLGMLKNLAGT